MERNIYRLLQQKINEYGPGFPASESGVEIQLLEILFSEKDAEFYLKMVPEAEAVEEIAKRTGADPNDTEKQLVHMLKNGTVLCFEKDGRTVYAPAPYIVGIYENLSDEMDENTAKLLEQYHNEAYFKNLADTMKVGLRYVPVKESLDPTARVFPHDDVIGILKSKNKIAVIDCPCRKQLEMAGKKTNKPLEVCFSFDSYAEYYVEKRKQGRYIDVDEAVAIQELCEKEGLVTQSSIMDDFQIMCHCDKNCIMFRAFENRIPTETFVSNYYSAIDADSCVGCGVCVERCHPGAIRITDEEFAEVDRSRCIGCGLCVTVCPTEAISLEQKPENEQLKRLLRPEDMAQLLGKG